MARIPNPFNQFQDNDGTILAGGQVWYYEPGSTTILKDTFSDVDNTTANTNPVILGQDGRLPDVFGEGTYRIELRAAPVFPDTVGRLIDEKDNVDVTIEGGAFSDWLATVEYSVGDIVKGSDGNYYISLSNNNLNNDPTTSPSDWGLYQGRNRNLLDNAQGRINQLGVSGTVVLLAGEYGHDRWRAGSGGCTYTFSVTDEVTTFNISAGSLEQEIEGANIFTNTLFLSWDGTCQAQIDGGGFGDSPITEGVTGGTNVIVEFGTGTFSLPQLQKGPNKSDFDYISIDKDLAACQRHQWVVNFANGTRVLAGQATSATFVAGASAYFPVTMRIAPTPTITAGALVGSVAAGTSAGGTGTVTASVDAFSATVSGAAGLVAGNASNIQASGATTIVFDSNL